MKNLLLLPLLFIRILYPYPLFYPVYLFFCNVDVQISYLEGIFGFPFFAIFAKAVIIHPVYMLLS